MDRKRFTREQIQGTIAYLRKCQEARRAGYPVYLTTDPTWLLDMAIGRRAGWVEDPHSRGIMQPIRHREKRARRGIVGDGANVVLGLPRFGEGDAQQHLSQIARRVNTPRLRVYRSELGEWGPYLAARLPERFAEQGDY